MKEFFKVTDLEKVLEYRSCFPIVPIEEVALFDSSGRILAADIFSEADLPDFKRSTMDGYAVCASSTFGASSENPAYITLKGTVSMGEPPAFSIGQGEAGRISTGGMLPDCSDSVVMIEHTEAIDDNVIEVYGSIAPGKNVLDVGEDIKKKEVVLYNGQKIRPQETGLLAALGYEVVKVYKQPVIGIISTGDEVVPVNEIPGTGRIRDVNTYTLASLVRDAGGVPISYGIVQDDFDDLYHKCTLALAQTDMVLISGGSSVGVRDFTIDVLSSLPDPNILVHGISISPGKPTILASVGNSAFWGIPGHVVSAMIVFEVVVRPFIEHIGGLSLKHKRFVKPTALLSRNISSAQGRRDYIRVRLIKKGDTLWAEPILGKSGLINTMIKADGLIEIDMNTEGLDKGSTVEVITM
jgi:molybdopterin molybdotransferase